MKKRLQWIYNENGDLSKKGIVFVVIVSIAVALFLDVVANNYHACADGLENEPRYTIQEVISMGYLKVK